MRLEPDTVSAARRYVDLYGNRGAAGRFGIHPAIMSDVVNDRTNVSRDKENRIRETVGLPLLPSFETVEVPPGAEVRVVRPSKRKRKPRYSVPADPKAAGEYLAKRYSVQEVSKLIESLLSQGETDE